MPVKLGVRQVAPGTYADYTAGSTLVTGLVLDGVTDNTSVLTAAINAASSGTTLLLPAGKILFSTLPDVGTKRIRLKGVGFHTTVTSAFGSATWGVLSNFNGTVLISSATSGTAIAATGAFGVIDLENLGLIGPGSGTSVGVQLGHRTSAGMTRADWRNVVVANFSTDVSWAAEVSKADRLTVLGCNTGLEFVNAPIANVFTNFEATNCATRAIDGSAGTLNQFNQPTIQGNPGDGFYSNGASGFVFISPYFENNGPGKNINVVSGDYHQFVDLHHGGTATSTIAGNQCAIINPQGISAMITVTGARFYGVGFFAGNLTGSGLTAANGTILFDTSGNAALVVGNNDLRIPSGKWFYFESSGTNSKIGRETATGDTVIGSGTSIVKADASKKLCAPAGLGCGNSAAATTLGSVVKKMQVFDMTGASLGYVAIYDAIT